jgi:hypothetical protein
MDFRVKAGVGVGVEAGVKPDDRSRDMVTGCLRIQHLTFSVILVLRFIYRSNKNGVPLFVVIPQINDILATKVVTTL